MIEIKCPFKRILKKDYVPEKYYYQIQGQLAVCELEECDYVECYFKRYDTDEEYINEVKEKQFTNTNHGIIAEYLDKINDCYYYIYSDKNQDSWGMVEPINIQKYLKNGGFKKFHSEKFGSSIALKRHLVFMTYLNDVEDGGTSFKYQGIDIPAKKGLTLIWPAYWTHTHKGIISKTKEKYIVTGWLNFINHRKKQIREGTVQP